MFILMVVNVKEIKRKSCLPFTFTWIEENAKVTTREIAARRGRPESFIVFAVVEY